MSSFEIKNISGIDFSVIPQWTASGIINATSFRNGGTSSDLFASLNLGFNTEDSKENVLENRKRFFSALNTDPKKIIALTQIHSDRIMLTSAQDSGRGALDISDTLASADGLLTDEKEVPICIFTADCIPVFFNDPKKKIIGVAHAGWRGTVSNIAKNMIDMMMNIYGSNPGDILAGLGPGIEVCCYEVGDDIFELFPDTCRRITKGKKYVDLKRTIKQRLLEQNLKEENIAVSQFCTFCRQDLAYSARAVADHRKTGRMCSFLMSKI